MDGGGVWCEACGLSWWILQIRTLVVRLHSINISSTLHVSFISILNDIFVHHSFGGWVGPHNKWHFVSWSLCLLSFLLLSFSDCLACEKQAASRAQRWARFGQTFHRSYPCENTRSHSNSEVKHMWAGLVEWWVTTFESPVLKAFLFSFFFVCSSI